MPEIARIIGGAGTGKTTRLLRTMEKLIDRGYDPREIGFVSFTRAARAEASARAASAFNLRPEELEAGGWFRTIHSICYKQLAYGDGLLADTAKDREWVEQAIQAEIRRMPAYSEDGGGWADDESREPTDAEVALSLWSVARNRLVSLDEQHNAATLAGEDLPSVRECRELIERYEQAKRLDGRCDFTDLLSRFAGVRCTVDGPAEAACEGEVPRVPVWFFDEQQDTSALADRVCRRLVEDCDYVYLCLDPFQSIYGFSGADARHAMAWDVKRHNEHVLPKSYRCPDAVLRLGEAILQDCSDYWDRGIAPADHEGDVESIDFRETWTDDVDPNGSWLLIARTNHLAKRIAGRLNYAGIPWVPTKGNGGWLAPVRNEAIRALRRTQRDGVFTVRGWQAIVKQIPSKVDAGELLVRGAKTQAAKLEESDDLVGLDHLHEFGGTELLKSMIFDGRWRPLIKGADDWEEASRRWGEAAADVEHWPAGQGVRVGTVHSVKGAEADNVLLLTTTSARVQRAIELTTDGDDAERRVAYVGVTRARRRLIVADEPTTNRMEIPV